MTRLQAAEQLRRALQFFANTLDETAALEIASVYAAYEVGRTYKQGAYLTYGVNSVGDPQLYKVVQNHTSQADWTPDRTPALYTAVGISPDGYPEWSQPAGAHDAYNKGDKCVHGGVKWVSTVDANVWEPGVYGWDEVKGE